MPGRNVYQIVLQYIEGILFGPCSAIRAVGCQRVKYIRKGEQPALRRGFDLREDDQDSRCHPNSHDASVEFPGPDGR